MLLKGIQLIQICTSLHIHLEQTAYFTGYMAHMWFNEQFIDIYVKRFLDKLYNESIVTVPCEKLFLKKLPYIGSSSKSFVN